MSLDLEDLLEALMGLHLVHPSARREDHQVVVLRDHSVETLVHQVPSGVHLACDQTADDHRGASFPVASYGQTEVHAEGTVFVPPWGNSCDCCGSCSCPRGNLGVVETEVAYLLGMDPGQNLDHPFAEAFQGAESAVPPKKILRNRRNV